MAVSRLPKAKRKAAPATESPRDDGAAAKRTRKKDPGVRVIGGRIYDPQNGKTCHQCRQKTMDFFAPCKNERNGKPCPICFCHKCLLNRYGEKAEDVAKVESWSCPKCRGICNCSFCMKKKGQEPTGILVHAAKAIGFNSVSDLLHQKGAQAVKEIVASAAKSPISSVKSGKKDKKKSDVKVELTESELGTDTLNLGEGNKENAKKKRKRVLKMETCAAGDQHEVQVETKKGSGDEKVTSESNGHIYVDNQMKGQYAYNTGKEKKKKNKSIKMEKEKVEKKKKHLGMENGIIDGRKEAIQRTKAILKHLKHNSRRYETIEEIIPLPDRNSLTSLAGIELTSEDVGPVLQFLEFCGTFEKVLGLKKGQAETVLRELSRGPVGRRGLQPSIVQFHIKLLTLISNDTGEKPPSSSSTNEGSWLLALEKCIETSQCPLKGFATGLLNKGITGYNNLDFSEKLRVLNFLCDESLTTGELRCWIDKENSKFKERTKNDKQTNSFDQEEKKSIKQKLKADLAQTLLSLRSNTALTISEHDDLINQIKGKTEEIHAHIRDCVEMPTKKKPRSDAVRTEPTLLEGNGHAFWKLNCYDGGSCFLLQDVGSWESPSMSDKWFTYEGEQQKVVEKHVMLVRKQGLKRIKRLMAQDQCLVNNGSIADDSLGNTP